MAEEKSDWLDFFGRHKRAEIVGGLGFSAVLAFGAAAVIRKRNDRLRHGLEELSSQELYQYHLNLAIFEDVTLSTDLRNSTAKVAAYISIHTRYEPEHVVMLDELGLSNPVRIGNTGKIGRTATLGIEEPLLHDALDLLVQSNLIGLRQNPESAPGVMGYYTAVLDNDLSPDCAEAYYAPTYYKALTSLLNEPEPF